MPDEIIFLKGLFTGMLVGILIAILVVLGAVR